MEIGCLIGKCSWNTHLQRIAIADSKFDPMEKLEKLQKKKNLLTKFAKSKKVVKK